MGDFGGGPFGTVLFALFDDDTHDVLLFTWEARGGEILAGPRPPGDKFKEILEW